MKRFRKIEVFKQNKFILYESINAVGGWKRLPTGRHHWPVVPISLWLDMQSMNWLVLSKPLLKT